MRSRRENVPCLIAFCLSALLCGAASAGDGLDLAGSWRLEHREDFDAYLETTRVSWLKKRLAALVGSRISQTIEWEGQRCRITSVTGFKSITNDFIIDGKTRTKGAISGGERVDFTAVMEGEALVIDVTGPEGRRKTRREIIDDQLVMTVHHMDYDATMKLYFDRRR